MTAAFTNLIMLCIYLRRSPRRYKNNAYLKRKGLVLSYSKIYRLFNPTQLEQFLLLNSTQIPMQMLKYKVDLQV
jgi:hypothetical protein